MANTCAYATIIYDANATSTFTLIDADGLLITAEAGPELPSTMTSGSGTASIDADMQSDPALFPGASLVQSSDVSGSAGPTAGASSAVSMNSYLIILENIDTLDATAVFEFTYEWDVSLTQAPVSDAEFEAGVASAFFHLSGFAPSGSETLAIDDGSGIMSVSDWLFNPFITFDFDEIVTPGALSGSTSVLAYVTVPAFSTDSFSVITDASGSAARIPEPTAVVLFGLAVLLLSRRKYFN